MEYTPHFVIEGDINVNNGLSMIGADKDGSDIILSSSANHVSLEKKHKMW